MRGIILEKSSGIWVVRPLRSGGITIGRTKDYDVAVQMLEEYYRDGTTRPKVKKVRSTGAEGYELIGEENRSQGITWNKEGRVWIVRPSQNGNITIARTKDYDVAVKKLMEHYEKNKNLIKPIKIRGMWTADYCIKK